MNNPRWIQKEIDRLDPIKDAHRIAHLVTEVRYGFPLFTYSMFSIAFARQAAVPAIARALHRGGKGAIMTNPAKRNNETLVFFGLLFNHLGTPEGKKVAERIVQIHAPYKIPNDLNLYTLATIVCLPKRVSTRFLGKEMLSEKENIATYYYWKEVGELMGIIDVPDSMEAMLKWMLDYEASEYRYTKAGQEITQMLSWEFSQRWFPKPMQAWGQNLFYALFDDHLRESHQIPKPSKLNQRLVAAQIKVFLKANAWLPDPKDRNFVETFGKDYGSDIDYDLVGPPALKDQVSQ